MEDTGQYTSRAILLSWLWLHLFTGVHGYRNISYFGEEHPSSKLTDDLPLRLRNHQFSSLSIQKRLKPGMPIHLAQDFSSLITDACSSASPLALQAIFFLAQEQSAHQSSSERAQNQWRSC